MDTVAERLKYARDELRGMSQPALAKAVTEGGTRITYQSIQAIEDGGGSKHLNAIARALRIRPEWLELGEGPIEDAERASPTPEPPAPPLPDEEKWRQAVIDAEHFAARSSHNFSLEGKADLVVFFRKEAAKREKAGEKFDATEHYNVIEFALKLR